MKLYSAILMALTLTQVYGEERKVPVDILHGILVTETRSYVDATGNIVYVDKSRGAAGEMGPYQMTYKAFIQVYKGPRPRKDLETDPVFATKLATDYLLWLDKHYSKGDWNKAIQYYNAGPKNSSYKYLQKVRGYRNVLQRERLQ